MAYVSDGWNLVIGEGGGQEKLQGLGKSREDDIE
jgi:hypothetical protein